MSENQKLTPEPTVTIPRALAERLIQHSDAYATVLSATLVREQWQPVINDCDEVRALLAQPQGEFSHALAELADIKESQANEAILDEFAQPQGASAQEQTTLEHLEEVRASNRDRDEILKGHVEEIRRLADRVTVLTEAIREHEKECKADYAMPDGKTKVEGGEECDRKLWSHLREG